MQLIEHGSLTLSSRKNDAQKNAVLCSVDTDIQQPCVVIIGAGLAGLSAAHRLVQCGISNFRVLEASDRPGGRIKTCSMGDSIVELGSQWISGSSVANNVFTFAAQEGLLKPPLKTVNNSNGIFFTSDGRAVDFNLAHKIKSIFNDMQGKASNLFFSEEPLPQNNLSEFFDELIKEELKKLPEVERYDAARIFYGLENHLKSRIGDDLSEVGSLNELPGGNVMVPLGMGGILAPLIRDLPHCSLIYCKPVHSIRWGTTTKLGNPRAIVRCCDGQDFPADYVIITVSLGVLKKLSAILFCPELPAHKKIAIENLGFGYVNKIFMQYNNPFWGGKNLGFHLAWSPEELKNEPCNWIHGVSSFERVLGSSKILCATVSGKEAIDMENISNYELVNDLTKLISQFIGDRSLPPASSVMKSDWATNPNFYGAFTFIRKNSNVGDIYNLMEPLPENCDDIPPILLFAGEHTSPKYFATLHGARQSGIREADRIVSITKKIRGPPNRGPVCVPCT